MSRRWRLELLWSVPRPVTDLRLEALATDATGVGWCVARTPAGLSITAWVVTDRPEAELGRFAEVAPAWLRRAVPSFELVSLRACTAAEVAAELRRPVVPPLASVPDAAQILGVPREHVQQLRAQDPAFPAPVTRVSTGPLWTVEALRAYRRERGRSR